MPFAPLLLSLFLSPSSVPFSVLFVSVKCEELHLIMMRRGRRQDYYFPVISKQMIISKKVGRDIDPIGRVIEFSTRMYVIERCRLV